MAHYSKRTIALASVPSSLITRMSTPNDPDLAREEMAFAKKLSELVPRLELLGFTLDNVEAEYNRAAQESTDVGEAFGEENASPTPRLMTFLEFCAFISSHPIGELDDTFV